MVSPLPRHCDRISGTLDLLRHLSVLKKTTGVRHGMCGQFSPWVLVLGLSPGAGRRRPQKACGPAAPEEATGPVAGLWGEAFRGGAYPRGSGL